MLQIEPISFCKNYLFVEGISMNKFRRRRRIISAPEVNLIPLIDTSLTLLVIFMVTAPLVNNAIKVNLPSGKAKEDTGLKQEFVVYVDQHKKMFFNGTPMNNRDRLIDTIKNTVGSQKEQTVFVKADTAVNYGTVMELVDDIKVIGGVSYVALATKPSAVALKPT